MKKLLVLVAGGIGYVLGTKAGRERYDQIMRSLNKVKDDPRVQEKAHQAADFAKEQAPVVKDKVATAASGAAAKVRSDDPEKAGTDLNPDRLKIGEDTGPQGDLP